MSSSTVQTWATATTEHAGNGRVIIFRFADALRPEFEPTTQPVRVILQWKYEQEADKGMPLFEERVRMDAMEDLLDPVVTRDGLATLALVSTGEHLREWVYYAKDEDTFMTRLNQALGESEAFPLEIHVAVDAEWQTWRNLKSELKRD